MNYMILNKKRITKEIANIVLSTALNKQSFLDCMRFLRKVGYRFCVTHQGEIIMEHCQNRKVPIITYLEHLVRASFERWEPGSDRVTDLRHFRQALYIRLCWVIGTDYEHDMPESIEQIVNIVTTCGLKGETIKGALGLALFKKRTGSTMELSATFSETCSTIQDALRVLDSSNIRSADSVPYKN